MTARSPRMSLRLRLRVLRARLSLPALLSQYDERVLVGPAAAVNIVLAVAVLSLFAWISGMPLLFAALGPTAFIQCTEPFSASASPRSVVLGHVTGIASGLGALGLVQIVTVLGTGTPAGGYGVQVAAASLALALTAVLLVRFSLLHPPACGSALVVAMGAAETMSTIAIMVAAVTLMALMTTWLNRLAGIRPQQWSLRPKSSQACGHPTGTWNL